MQSKAASSNSSNPAQALPKDATSYVKFTPVSTFLLLSLLPLFLLFSSFSGSLSPGDFHAHKKWITLTLHLPPSEWYLHELDWWGLDYPPFCIFFHAFIGLIVKTLGYEDYLTLNDKTSTTSITLLRLISITLNILIYYLPLHLLSPQKPSLLMFIPILILIDVGHFQVSNYIPSVLTVLTLHFLNRSESWEDQVRASLGEEN
ncbi:hypothetical protein TL16_g04930 [Triparma laevis f. inornata]|uniref:Alpha-1,3-glucosyltransferase n=2 Tax=Triparma laevis TaxID=1534972 RepID=A0A9W7DZT8_9STRA|nr:hypothetical protein TrLO_g14693 [Triparma laevis f. longispina]GMH68421.1 hypothetical protein TL16_g04930 [Triparma laevis f. inornata]